MKNIDFFLIVYAALAFSSVTVLTLIGVDTVDVYLALFAIEFSVAVELSPRLNPMISSRMKIMQTIMIALFAMVVVARAIQVLRL